MASPSRAVGGDRLPSPEVIDEELIEDFVSHEISTPIMIPELFTTPPPIKDFLETATSEIQSEIVQLCLPFLAGEVEDYEYNENGVPGLDRRRHARLLRSTLGKLPAPFVAADAARPWFLYWCLSGLVLLGEDVSSYRRGVIETALSMQNDTGGFGGGNGHLSHLATTYAVVLALALVGGEEAFEVVDRIAMWRWVCSLKQPDGGFQVCLGGEEDIRGAYCAAVIITLLNIPLDLTPESPASAANFDQPNLFSGLAEYVRRCQTFEGGISGQPDGEAHGAYAFCALGCLSILDAPERIIPRYLDLPRLISWLSSRQHAPEGGFSGRTNKLVDGCYSHWVGGCWPLVEACLGTSSSPVASDLPGQKLPPATGSLFNREGLIRYILCCCQDVTKRGGLRDKPGKLSDQYHSCYVLSGLSSAQHQWRLEPAGGEETADQLDRVWTVAPYLDEVQIFNEQDRIPPIHPVYAIPFGCQEAIRSYFTTRPGF